MESAGTEEGTTTSNESRLIRFYHGLRRDVSLLLSEGHLDARNYSIAMLWSEARIVRQRHTQRAISEALTLQTAILSVLAKQGGKLFQEHLENLNDGY